MGILVNSQAVLALPCLSGCSEPDVRLLASMLRAVSHRAGQHLLQLDSPSRQLILVVEGRLIMIHLAPDGKEIGVGIIGSGEIVLLDALRKALASSVHLETMDSPTLVYVCLGEELRRLPTLCPSVASMLHSCSTDLTRRLVSLLCQSLEDVICRPVAVRLIRALLRVAQSGTVTVSRRHLACLAATTPEEVSRQLANLRERGLIQFTPHEHTITLLSIERLLAICEDLETT